MTEKDLDKVDFKDHPLQYGGLLRLLELEDQHYNYTGSEDYVVPLITLYCKLVEFYDKRTDMIKDYFLEKIQIISTSKREKPKKARIPISPRFPDKRNSDINSNYSRKNKCPMGNTDSSNRYTSIEARRDVRSKICTFENRVEASQEKSRVIHRDKTTEIIRKVETTFESNNNLVRGGLNSQENKQQYRLEQRRKLKLEKSMNSILMNQSREFSILNDVSQINGKSQLENSQDIGSDKNLSKILPQIEEDRSNENNRKNSDFSPDEETAKNLYMSKESQDPDWQQPNNRNHFKTTLALTKKKINNYDMPLKVKKGQYDSIEIPNNGIQDPVLDTEILIKQKSDESKSTRKYSGTKSPKAYINIYENSQNNENSILSPNMSKSNSIYFD